MPDAQLIDDSAFYDLVAMIEEAPLKPELWQDVCARISDAMRGAVVSSGAILVHSGGYTNFFLGQVNVDAQIVKVTHERFNTPETNLGIDMVLKIPPGSVAVREKFHPDRTLVRSGFYHELMRPLNVWHAAMANIACAANYIAPLGVERRASAGQFTTSELEFLRRLVPHLSRSVRVFMRLKETEVKAAAAGEVVDRLPQGVILTDTAGRIGSLNHVAQSILDEADGLVMRNSVLSASSRVEAAELSRLIREAAGSGSNGGLRPHGAMQVTRPSQRRALPVLVAPLRNGSPPMGHRLAVQVTVTDLDRLPETPPTLLCRFYGFTPREADVAALLLQGHSPSEVADQLAMTMNTVRTHIRHLLMKTGTERLTQLIPVLIRSPSL